MNSSGRNGLLSAKRVQGITLGLLLVFCQFVIISCSSKVDADPELVEAFKEADALLAYAAAGEVDEYFQYDAAGAINRLLDELSLQKSKYTKVRNSLLFQTTIKNLTTLFMDAETLGNTPSKEKIESFYEDWLNIRSDMRTFVGSVAKTKPPVVEIEIEVEE